MGEEYSVFSPSDDLEEDLGCDFVTADLALETAGLTEAEFLLFGAVDCFGIVLGRITGSSSSSSSSNSTSSTSELVKL